MLKLYMNFILAGLSPSDDLNMQISAGGDPIICVHSTTRSVGIDGLVPSAMRISFRFVTSICSCSLDVDPSVHLSMLALPIFGLAMTVSRYLLLPFRRGLS